MRSFNYLHAGKIFTVNTETVADHMMSMMYYCILFFALESSYSLQLSTSFQFCLTNLHKILSCDETAVYMGRKFKISKILNLRNSNLKTCRIPSKY